MKSDTLHTLEKIVSRKQKRVGRGIGSGKGSKSTRGTTRHQSARTTIAQSFEGGQGKMTKKYPLIRGKGRNKPLSEAPLTVTTNSLNKIKKDTIVTVRFLIENKLVSSNAKKRGVKIVSGDEVQVKLQVSVPVTAKAKALIEKAGGTCTHI